MRYLLALSAVLAAALLVRPAAPPRSDPADAHDLIVMHGKRPYRIRIHLQVAGGPYQTGWNQQVARLFRFLDADGDGVLAKAEVGRAPSREQWRQLTSGQRTIEPDAAPNFKELSGDGRGVRLGQLQAYYRASTAGPLQTSWGWRTISVDPVATALWQKLDRNRDGKLSRAEVTAAARILEPLDLDDDDVISVPELMGINYYNPPPIVTRGEAHGVAQGGLPFLSRLPGGPAQPLVKALLGRYDRDSSGTLTKIEIGLPAEVFARLDRNGDGALAPDELANWFDCSPDLELIAPLDLAHPVRVMPGPKGGLAFHPTREGGLISLGDWRVQFCLSAATAGQRPKGPRSALAVFRGLDRDNNGYLDSAEIYTPPFSHVSWHRLADRDGDGKLTEKEFIAFADLQATLHGQVAFVQVIDLARSLFRLIDCDGDGQLGPRELRAAWDQLAPWTGGKDSISRAGIPQQYRVIVGLGPLATAEDGMPLPRAVSARGPMWFRKMDRNGDGDVSLKEWLGTREQFRQIDADGDGLISVDEAERYDRRMRGVR